MKDTEHTIGIQSKALVLGESVRDNQTGALPESTQDLHGRIKVDDVPVVDVYMGR